MWKRLFILIPISIIILNVLPPASVMAQDQLVKNGTFSGGLSYWSTGVISQGGYSGYPKIGVQNNFQGDPSLYIDAPGGADGYAEQTITIPNSNNVALQFYTWGNHDPVTITVSVRAGGSETVLDRFDPSCKIDKGCRSPQFKSYNITSFSGQTIILRLRVASSYGTGTFGWFDDVQILATRVPEPSRCSGIWDVWGLGGVSPSYELGATISGSLSYKISNNWDSPGAIGQVLVGIIDQSGKPYNVTCIYDGNPRTCPDYTSGTGSFSLTAPSSPGTYKLIAAMDRHYSCSNAKGNFPNQGDKKHLATIEIRTQKCTLSTYVGIYA